MVKATRPRLVAANAPETSEDRTQRYADAYLAMEENVRAAASMTRIVRPLVERLAQSTDARDIADLDFAATLAHDFAAAANAKY